jgi:hypothetical protein
MDDRVDRHGIVEQREGGRVESLDAHAASTAGEEALRQRLREGDGERLLLTVRAHLSELDPGLVRLVLRNPFCDQELIDLLADQQPLLAAYEVRRDLAAHPRTREVLALRFVAGLYWRDLVAVGTDVRVRPTVRRAADLALMDRLPGMAVGERISIARVASGAVVSRLLHDPTTKVVEAVLENPRLTEGQVVQLAASETALPAILALVATHRRWAPSYTVRVTLARNPRTPAAIALPLLASLRKGDLRAVANEPRIAQPVRHRARLLLGDT